MKILISASSHKRYAEIIREHNMPFDCPHYIPENGKTVGGVRERLLGFGHDSYILMGTFYAEEYEHLFRSGSRIFEISEIDWSEDHAKKQKL